jgi:outer membrane protein TolC
VFEDGSLLNRRATAKAALADYRQTVLQSLAQVADTLSAIDHDSKSAATMARADEGTQTGYRLV